MRRGKSRLELGMTNRVDPEHSRVREKRPKLSWKRRKKDRRTEEQIASEMRGLIIPLQSLGKTDISQREVDVETEVGEKTGGMVVWVQEENGVRDRGRETSTSIVVLTGEKEGGLTGEIEGGLTTTPRGCLSRSLTQLKFQDWETSLRYVVCNDIRMLQGSLHHWAHCNICDNLEREKQMAKILYLTNRVV